MHPNEPQRPPQPPPVVYVQQKSGNTAATVGIWTIVLLIVGPVLLIALCCLGALGFFGSVGLFTGPDGSPTP